METSTPKKRARLNTNFMGFFALLFLVIVSTSCGGGARTNPDGTPMTERQMLVDDQFSGWDGSHPALTQTIKKSMKDPDSYEHVSTMFKDQGDNILVVTKYRGKNVFGAMVTEDVTATVDFDGRVVEVE